MEYRQPIYAPPAGAADLLLIRHGESAAARADTPFATIDGFGNPPLHPAGEAQAEAVAIALEKRKISDIYVTKLQRTQQTAAPLTKRLSLTPKVDPDLHEVFLGDWDGGLYRLKVAARDPVYLAAAAAQDWAVIPNGESRAAFFTRVERGLRRIGAAHSDECVAVFVHGGVIGAALAIASGAEPFAFMGAANGSISRLVIHGDRMTVRGFNETGHL